MQEKCKLRVNTHKTKQSKKTNQESEIAMLEQELREADQKTVLRELLKADKKVFVVLDSTKPGVVLPEYLMGKANVKLKISRNFSTPVEVSNTDVQTVLTFASTPFNVVIPLDAIYALADFDKLAELDFYTFDKSIPEIKDKELEMVQTYLDTFLNKPKEKETYAPRRLLKK